VERGQTNVTIDVITTIAVSLSVTVAELFGAAPPIPQGERAFPMTERDLEQIDGALVVIRNATRAARRRG
jgi:hypothetical protein